MLLFSQYVSVMPLEVEKVESNHTAVGYDRRAFTAAHKQQEESSAFSSPKISGGSTTRNWAVFSHRPKSLPFEKKRRLEKLNLNPGT